MGPLLGVFYHNEQMAVFRRTLFKKVGNAECLEINRRGKRT